jgi:hypothetical protein
LNSSWPTLISLPLVVYTWIVVITRFIGFRSTPIDRRVSIVFLCLAIGSTLREPTIQHWLVQSTDGRLSAAALFQLGLIIMAAQVGLPILIVASMLGREYVPVVVHSIAIGTAVAALILGSGARRQGIMIEEQTGWAPLGFWIALLVVMWWLDVLVVWLCVAQFRAGGDGREVFVYCVVLLLPFLHIAGFMPALIGAVYQVGGHDNVFSRVQAFLDRDVLLNQTALFAIGLTIPIVLRLARRLGLDSASRHRKRLLPLWSDLTAACPEIIYRDSTGTGFGSQFLLHRTVIEIRDCLRILSRYGTADAAVALSAQAPDHEVMDFALRLAQACAAKSGGAAPSCASTPMPSLAGDVGDEIAELTALAACWERANAVENQPIQVTPLVAN